METIRIHDITEADWCRLRDHLTDNGWAVGRGGGLDHSWVELRKADLRILMEHDRWAGTEVVFDAASRNDMLAALPEGFLQAYATFQGASGGSDP